MSSVPVSHPLPPSCPNQTATITTWDRQDKQRHSRERQLETTTGREEAQRDEQDFEFVRTLMITLAMLSSDPAAVKVGIIFKGLSAHKSFEACLSCVSGVFFTCYPARMHSRGKVIGLYVCRRCRCCCRHENRQFSRSTCLCVM